MRNSALACACLLLAAALGPTTSFSASGLTATLPESRSLDPAESYERLVDESTMLLIARVLFVDSTATPIEQSRSANAADLRERPIKAFGHARRVMLEPVEWLRGGLDGETIEVISRETPGMGRSVHLAWIASADTLGVLVRLQRWGQDWAIVDPLRAIPQRSFRAVRDSALQARRGMGIDSLTARADLILVTRDSLVLRGNEREKHGQVRAMRTLKGVLAGPTVDLRVWRSFRCMPGDVLFLHAAGGGEYETIPFHRDKPPVFDLDTPRGLTAAEIESAVRVAQEASR